MPPLVIAHRGSSRLAPENTLAAFRLAWEDGADAVETDLRLSADGKIVAFHDADGRRTLGTKDLVSGLTLAELRTLDAGIWKSLHYRNERVPTLAEVMATAPDSGRIVLELKEGSALVTALVTELRACSFDPARIHLIAFDPAIIAEAKRALPACMALWLFKDYAALPPQGGEWLADHVRTLGVDGVDLRFVGALSERIVAPLHAAGCTIFCYTVNSAAGCRRAARMGIHGITTDRPADARRWLRANST